MSKLSVNEALAKAKVYTLQGQNAKAQSLYEAILKVLPKNQQALMGLSSLKRARQSLDQDHPPSEDMQRLQNLYKSGKLKQAFDLSHQLTLRFPKAYLVWNIQGAAAAQIGDMGSAVKAFQTITALRPTYSAGHFNLGNLFKELGQYSKAKRAYKAALSYTPNYPEAQYNLGIIYELQDQLVEAVTAYEEAIALKPNFAEAYNNLGNVLASLDQSNAALEAYENAIRFNPQFGDAYNNLAKLLIKLGNTKDAIEMYQKALIFEPKSAEILYNFGNALRISGMGKEAQEAFEKAVEIKTDYAEAYNNLGLLHKDWGRHSDAEEAFQTALRLNPAQDEAKFNLGNVLQEQGKIDAAVTVFEDLLETSPQYASAYRALSALISYHDKHPHMSKVEAVLCDDQLSQEQRCELHYACAKMKEDMGELQEAFEHYVAGGQIRKKLLRYDLAEDQQFFLKVKQHAVGIRDQGIFPIPDPKMPTPIFILGMPRSGTTLVEQILSCHSEVQGGGELPFLRQHADGLHFGRQIVTSGKLDVLRMSYLNDLAKRSHGKGFVTDKLPHNFLCIALIRAALPEAKIIHLCRDASATCWSNFKHYFSTAGLGYSYDLSDVVDYFSLYRDLMAFWERNYRDTLYHLDYEALTNDQENETRKLLQYVNLPWERACLLPHKNTRSVRTASQQQVRQKIYQGASKNWEKFKPYLNGAFNPLHEF